MRTSRTVSAGSHARAARMTSSRRPASAASQPSRNPWRSRASPPYMSQHWRLDAGEFPDDSFDISIDKEDSVLEAAEELRRIVQPGGVAIVATNVAREAEISFEQTAAEAGGYHSQLL